MVGVRGVRHVGAGEARHVAGDAGIGPGLSGGGGLTAGGSALAARVAVMYLSKIVETARTEAIFERPLHPYSRALIASVFPPEPGRRRDTFRLRGEIPSAIDLPTGCFLYSRCPMGVSRCTVAHPPLFDIGPGRASACYRAEEVPPPEQLPLHV